MLVPTGQVEDKWELLGVQGQYCHAPPESENPVGLRPCGPETRWARISPVLPLPEAGEKHPSYWKLASTVGKGYGRGLRGTN